MPTFLPAGSRGTNSWTDRERVLKNFSAIFNAVKVTGQSVKGKGKVREDSSATLLRAETRQRTLASDPFPSPQPSPLGRGRTDGSFGTKGTPMAIRLRLAELRR